MKPGKPAAGNFPCEDREGAALRSLRGHLELDETEAALGVYQKAREQIAGWKPPPPEWLDLIKALVKHQMWESAVAVMQSYVEEVEAPSPRVRLKLAQLLVQKQERPARALRVLEQLENGPLPENLEAIRRQLGARARQMLEEGVLELGDEV
jgi:hypothetical protein